MTLHEALKRHVAVNGSQKEAARVLCISPQHLCDMLKGRREISGDIAELLGFNRAVTYLEKQPIHYACCIPDIRRRLGQQCCLNPVALINILESRPMTPEAIVAYICGVTGLVLPLVREARESEQAVGAVDPHAANQGKPSTRA